MQLTVNPIQRHAKMRAHTATHLLHALIAQLIPTTQQAGSLVDDDYLRFDYTSDEMLTSVQLNMITSQINHIIAQWLDVTTTEMSYDEAIDTWAKAFFQDKYGDVVRVVQVLWGENLTSIELCGGTHVSNTREIWSFVIIEQSPVASGTKRIVAYTWPKCYEYSHDLELQLQSIANKLWVTAKQIDEKLSKTLKDYEDTKSSIESLKSRLIGSQLNSELQIIENYKIYNIWLYGEHHQISISDVVNISKSTKIPAIIISSDWWYAIVWLNAKAFAQSHNLRGGGSDGLFQGKDAKVLELI